MVLKTAEDFDISACLQTKCARKPFLSRTVRALPNGPKLLKDLRLRRRAGFPYTANGASEVPKNR